jgi:hypothetical protein
MIRISGGKSWVADSAVWRELLSGSNSLISPGIQGINLLSFERNLNEACRRASGGPNNFALVNLFGKPNELIFIAEPEV